MTTILILKPARAVMKCTLLFVQRSSIHQRVFVHDGASGDIEGCITSISRRPCNPNPNPPFVCIPERREGDV